MLRIYPVVLEVVKQLRPALQRIELKDRDLTRQLRRCSLSIALNLAACTAAAATAKPVTIVRSDRRATRSPAWRSRCSPATSIKTAPCTTSSTASSVRSSSLSPSSSVSSLSCRLARHARAGGGTPQKSLCMRSHSAKPMAPYRTTKKNRFAPARGEARSDSGRADPRTVSVAPRQPRAVPRTRGKSSAKLQGLVRMSSCGRMIFSSASFTAPVEPGSAKTSVPPHSAASARD